MNHYVKLQFGQLYLGKTPQPIPMDPTKNGDIPKALDGHTINMGNTVDNGITWVKPNAKNIFVADRVLLRDISWTGLKLNGYAKGREVVIDNRRFRCRMLTAGTDEGRPNEWDKILDATIEDNDVWHWKDMCFWGANEIAYSSSSRAIRGYHSARYWNHSIASQLSADTGFRPALEPMHPHTLSICKKIRLEEKVFIVTMLQGSDGTIFYPQIHPVCSNLFQGIPDGSIIKMYTLLCDGRPVRQDVALPDIQRKNNTRLELTDKFLGDEFLIPWVISNGVAIAAKPLLGGLSPEILNNYISSN